MVGLRQVDLAGASDHHQVAIWIGKVCAFVGQADRISERNARHTQGVEVVERQALGTEQGGVSHGGDRACQVHRCARCEAKCAVGVEDVLGLGRGQRCDGLIVCARGQQTNLLQAHRGKLAKAGVETALARGVVGDGALVEQQFDARVEAREAVLAELERLAVSDGGGCQRSRSDAKGCKVHVL